MKFLKTLTFLSFCIFMMSCGGGTGTDGGNVDNAGNDDIPTRDIDPNSAKAHFTKLGDVKKIGPAKTELQQKIEALQDQINISDNPYVGYWVGKFGKNMINIMIATAENGKVGGYSVCAGNYRMITGTYKNQKNGKTSFILDEPGDDRYDGRFEFTIDGATKSLAGSWSPFEPDGNSAKKYTLKKRAYKYDKTVGENPETAQRLLEGEEIYNYDADDLRMMRSEIYARHGYSFKEKDMRYFFESKEWYMPMSNDIRGKLSDIETANIDLIYEYETYVEEHYDDFGR